MFSAWQGIVSTFLRHVGRSRPFREFVANRLVLFEIERGTEGVVGFLRNEVVKRPNRTGFNERFCFISGQITF